MEKELNKRIAVSFDLNPYIEKEINSDDSDDNNNNDNDNINNDINNNDDNNNEDKLKLLHEESLIFLENERKNRMETQLLLDEANLKLQERTELLESKRKFYDSWAQGVASITERARALGDIVSSHQG